MELKLLEFYNAEQARDKILQELEERGFTSERQDAGRGLGERIVAIILQECYPQFSPSELVSPLEVAESVKRINEETLDELFRDLTTELKKEKTLDEIFDDFLNDRNDQNTIT